MGDMPGLLPPPAAMGIAVPARGAAAARVAAAAAVTAAATAALGAAGAFVSPEPGPPKGGMPPNPPLPFPAGVSDAPAAIIDGWLRTARRTVSGRSTNSSVRSAWHRTLRIVAASLGAVIVHRRPYKSSAKLAKRFRRKEVIVVTDEEVLYQQPSGELAAADAPAAVRALRRLELPFFATSAERVERPLWGLRVRGNLRPFNAPAWGAEQQAAVRDALEKELGRSLEVHLLRADDAQEDDEQRFELLVVAQGLSEEQPSTAALAVSACTLVCALAFAQGLGASELLRAVGGPVALGSSLPVAVLVGLLAFGEATRHAVAWKQGVQLSLPVVCPSPQLGLLGTFSTAATSPASRASALALSLAAPVALAMASALLLLCGPVAGPGGPEVALLPGANVAWPLEALAPGCGALAWAGTQGLLAAAYMLLPHSPDGQQAWACLLGQRRAKQLSEVSAYVHPALGILAAWTCGEGWLSLPLWWAFLTVNLAPGSRRPPQEELSEVPPAARPVALAALLAAIACAAPVPLPRLAEAMQAAVSGAALPGML